MLKKNLSIILSLVLLFATVLPGFSALAAEETTTVAYSTVDPRATSVALSTDYTGGTIIYTLDGTSPAVDNGTEYTGAISVPTGTIRLTSAVFAGGVKVSEDFCHTYINSAETHLGVQTDTTKITAENQNASNPASAAFDGVSEFKYTSGTAMGLDRKQYENPITATIEYDTPITVDTLTAIVRICEAQYLNSVSAGNSGKNSLGTTATNTEYLTKDLSVQLKVDYVKEGESEFTEGVWQTVTMPTGYACEWNYEKKYGAAWTYLPAISFEGATITKIKISILDYATGSDAADVRLWMIKEYELYQSKGVTPEVKYSSTNPKTTTSVALTSNVDGGTIIYTLDGTSPAVDNGTEYTGEVAIPRGTIRLTSAVFKNGAKVSEDFCHTYVNNAGTHLGVQTTTSKISTSLGTNPGYALDGNSSYSYPTQVFSTSRKNLPNAITITAEYDDLITFDTLSPMVTINANAYVTGVTTGANGKNSDGTTTNKTEYTTKEMSLQFKVDYVEEGETAVTEGEWQTVTIPAGYPCMWSQDGGSAQTYLYTPAIAVDTITTKKIVISVKDYAESADVAKIWGVKEYELYKSKGVEYTVNYSKGSGMVVANETISLSSNKADTIVRYTTDGTAPTATSAVYSTPITIPANSITKINAAVFNAEDVQLSDLYSNVYVAGSYTNRAVQADADKITYTEYTDANNRYPEYAFDGDDAFKELHKVWSVKADLDVNVTYDNPVVADALLVSAVVYGTIVDTENMVTTEDAYIKMNVKNGNTSVTGGEVVLMLPAGSKVNAHVQSDGVNTTTSYWTWIGTGAVESFSGTSITYTVTEASYIGSIKEIELIKTGAVSVALDEVSDAPVVTANNSFDEAFDVHVIKAGYVVDSDSNVSVLEDVDVLDWTISANAVNSSFDVSSFKEITGVDYIKYFVWSGDMITPMTESIRINN